MKNSKKRQQQQIPSLRFSPTAWAKLLFMRDMTDNEVGGFGICDTDDLLYVTDFELVKQKVTAISVSFDDEAVADYFEDNVEAGRKPEQFGRIWLHTHPGSSAEPSATDEDTFERVFGNCDFSVMCIVSKSGNTYARLRFNTGPGAEIKIPISVDYSCEFEASDFVIWQQKYLVCIIEEPVSRLNTGSRKMQRPEIGVFGSDSLDRDEILSELDSMDPLERQYFMEELSIRSEFWDECESEDYYE